MVYDMGVVEVAAIGILSKLVSKGMVAFKSSGGETEMKVASLKSELNDVATVVRL